jgi:hypothetical protein
MPKPELQEFARKAAATGAPANTVGAFLEVIEEEESVYTYLFETKQKGYIGWRWSVTIFDAIDGPTVSEVLLMPGPDSLVAPKWIPWSERLADWKALQAELERQAAEEAALAAEEDEDADDSDDDSDESDELDAAEVDADAEAESEDEDEGEGGETEVAAENELAPNGQEDSATTDLEPGEDAEADSGKARSRIPRFIRRRGRRGKNKDND